MQQVKLWAAGAVIAGGLALGSCEGKQSQMDTSTPTSTLGTESAAPQAGGTMPADTSRMAAPSGTLHDMNAGTAPTTTMPAGASGSTNAAGASSGAMAPTGSSN